MRSTRGKERLAWPVTAMRSGARQGVSRLARPCLAHALHSIALPLQCASWRGWQCEARHGVSRQRTVLHGKAGGALLCGLFAWRFVACRGWHCLADHGEALQRSALQCTAGLGWRCMAVQGSAKRGNAPLCAARLAWRGVLWCCPSMPSTAVPGWLCQAWPRAAGFVSARRGVAGKAMPGSARPGAAWPGNAWRGWQRAVRHCIAWLVLGTAVRCWLT